MERDPAGVIAPKLEIEVRLAHFDEVGNSRVAAALDHVAAEHRRDLDMLWKERPPVIGLESVNDKPKDRGGVVIAVQNATIWHRDDQGVVNDRVPTRIECGGGRDSPLIKQP